jgi:4'-phosphopantetheinyl transferase
MVKPGFYLHEKNPLIYMETKKAKKGKRGENMWNRPSERMEIASDEAHIWRLHLNQDPAIVAKLSAMLTSDERNRADKYHRAVDRDHFIVARGVLRKIISIYLSVPPQDLKFTYGQYGKPSISGEQNDRNLNFNLSHSNELALYALTNGRAVGIDIEYLRGDFATLDIAQHFFAREEVKALESLPQDQRVKAFFNCWSRKESYIKAIGMGVSFPLDRFAVSLAPDDAPALLKVEGDDREAGRWEMYELLPGEGYAAAVIVEKPTVILKQWQW